MYWGCRMRCRISRVLLSCAFFVVAGCKGGDAIKEPPPHEVRFDLFSPAKAFGYVEKLVALGPRVSGTPGAENAARHIHTVLADLGIPARLDTWWEDTPEGSARFYNVIGRLESPGDRLLILGSHFDTKDGISPDFEGANDSGSSSGLLIELGRVLAASDLQYDIGLAFFDGEECKKSYGPNDGLHGSRRYASQLVADGLADRVAGVLILDMIGDRDLTVTLPRNSSPDLLRRVLAAAHKQDAREHFALYPYGIGDDHVPFLERGMPAIDIIDFYFGSGPEKNNYWHTTQDTMERISEQSLDKVGRVVLQVIQDFSVTTVP